MYSGWDSNPHCTGLKPDVSADWTTEVLYTWKDSNLQHRGPKPRASANWATGVA